MLRNTRLIAVIVIIALISFWNYGSFLNNFFVFDDYWILENNITGGLHKTLFGYQNLRIVGNLILWFDYLISGFDPAAYGLARIVMHVINATIIYLTLGLTFNNRLIAFFAAIIFAASSASADALLWRAAFLTQVSLFFYMTILYFYIKGKKENEKAWHFTALATFIVAIFNKEDIASLPFMIIVIEIVFFGGWNNLVSIGKKVAPYFSVIILFITLTAVASRYLGLYQEHMEKFLTFRPLHILFSGFTAFFIKPNSSLDWSAPDLYLFLLFIPISFFLAKDKKLLLFGYTWVFISFLPQSFTSATSINPKYSTLTSLSRHLYLPSVGSAIVFALLLFSIKEKFNKKIFIGCTSFFLVSFLMLHHYRIKERGEEWQYSGLVMKNFLSGVQSQINTFEGTSAYVHAMGAPEGRAYVQRALRAFYKNENIVWVDDPRSKVSQLKEGEHLYVIVCKNYNYAGKNNVKVYRVQ